MDEPGGQRKEVEVGVGALIFDKTGRLLLVKAKQWVTNRYMVPTGHVEYGEKLVDTVRREIKEETNLDVSDIKPLLTGELIFSPDFFNKDAHLIYFVYSCKTNDPTKIKLNEELTSYLWVTPAEAEMLDIYDNVRDAIKKYMQK